LNVAVAVLFAISPNAHVPVVVLPEVTEQLAFVTLGAVPPHAVKLNEDCAVAVRVTVVPLTYRAEQVPDSVSGVVDVAAVWTQLICPVLSVTVPEPVPCKVTVRSKMRSAPARKKSGRAFVSCATRFVAEDMKPTV